MIKTNVQRFKDNFLIMIIYIHRMPYYDLCQIPEFTNILNKKELVNSKLNAIQYSTKSNQTYTIVRYDKEILCQDLIPSYGLFRSVIINNSNKVVSFAPPKSLSYEAFLEKNTEKNNSIVAEEFVEGTMINLFWDPMVGLNGSWEIATRNTVGANVSFYKNGLTFNSMFLEACKENALDISVLDKKYCYSFVLQHPENRIVVPFKKVQLYLVEIYHIVNTEETVTVDIVDITTFFNYGFAGSSVRLPEVYYFDSYTELKDKYASLNTSYDILGVVIKDMHTGLRCKIRNPVYEDVRHLKGNHPKLQYQYLSLRQQGKVKEYLAYYPEHKKFFSNVRDQLHAFTETLFQNYIKCYIKKEQELKTFPSQFKTHMFKLHEIYRNELKPANLYVTNTVSIKYVNSLHPSQQMFALNYPMRKRLVDFINL